MDKQRVKSRRRTRRRIGIRKRVIGTPERPRLAVYRSLKHIYVQLIDDINGVTIVSAGTRDKAAKLDATGNADAATEVGKTLAARAKDKGVSKVVFDRGGFRYHGRIKALADAARESGLEF